MDTQETGVQLLSRGGVLLLSMIGCEPCAALKELLLAYAAAGGREVRVTELRPSHARELIALGEVEAFPSLYWLDGEGTLNAKVGYESMDIDAVEALIGPAPQPLSL